VTLGWAVLLLVALGILGVAVFALMKIADENDHEARLAERVLVPLSDVEVTQANWGG
jgi:hypothetical protein